MMRTKALSEAVLVYDEKCEVLEQARVAYSTAINHVLSEISVALLQQDGFDTETKDLAQHPIFRPSESPSPDLRRVLEYNTFWPDNQPDLSVQVRFAAPWTQKSGYLQLGIISIDRRWTHALNELVRTDAWVSSEIRREETFEEGWIYLASISLSDPSLIRTASELLLHLLHLVFRARKALRQTHLGYLMEWCLAACRRRLPLAMPGFKVLPDQDWQGQSFVQLRAPSHNGFWVAYQREQRAFMFGNNDFPNHQDQERLQQALRQIGARDFKAYCNFPSGIIMNQHELAESNETEILDKMMAAFKVYATVATHPTLIPGPTT